MANNENLTPHNFKPGQSGNPKGREKGAHNRSTIVKKWLTANMPVVDPITKKKVKGTVEDNIVMAIIGKAMKGDVQAFKELMDSSYCKASQQVDVTTLGEAITKKADLSNLTDEELETMAAIQHKMNA